MTPCSAPVSIAAGRRRSAGIAAPTIRPSELVSAASSERSPGSASSVARRSSTRIHEPGTAPNDARTGAPTSRARPVSLTRAPYVSAPHAGSHCPVMRTGVASSVPTPALSASTMQRLERSGWRLAGQRSVRVASVVGSSLANARHARSTARTFAGARPSMPLAPRTTAVVASMDWSPTSTRHSWSPRAVAAPSVGRTSPVVGARAVGTWTTSTRRVACVGFSARDAIRRSACSMTTPPVSWRPRSTSPASWAGR